MPIKSSNRTRTINTQPSRKWLTFPVIALGAEYLAMSLILMRNILAYKAHQTSEGYDLVCVHPNPRHTPSKQQKSKVRIQVKSRYQTNAERGCFLKTESLDAFDYLIFLKLNLGDYSRGRDGSDGKAPFEYYVLPVEFVRKYHISTGVMPQLRLRDAPAKELERFRGEVGLEHVARDLGVERPLRKLT